MADNITKTARRPDYRLHFLNKETEEKCEIGAAWVNKSGSISLVVNPLVVIPPGSSTVLTLFPTSE